MCTCDNFHLVENSVKMVVSFLNSLTTGIFHNDAYTQLIIITIKINEKLFSVRLV